MLEVQSLEVRYGAVRVLRGVSFAVEAGQVVALLGANGAGKTTTFRMLCGLLPASGGSVSVAGYDLRHSAASARARIGYMSQKFSLYDNLTVRQNLRFFASAYGLSGRRRRARIDWAMEELDLRETSEANAMDLSLGFKQRLALACALMHDPDILFLDEPTSGVDPIARREFWFWINTLSERGVTVMVTTHFMEEAEYCDRMLIMSQGDTLAMGTPSEIRALARSEENSRPTIEDAFVALATGGGKQQRAESKE